MGVIYNIKFDTKWFSKLIMFVKMNDKNKYFNLKEKFL